MTTWFSQLKAQPKLKKSATLAGVGVCALSLTIAGLVTLDHDSASALPPDGPGPKGVGTIEIDDSHAIPGGYIVLTGHGLAGSEEVKGENGNVTGYKNVAFSDPQCKLLLTPASATSDKNDTLGWFQLNWTNPDGLEKAGRTIGGVTYQAVEQPEGKFGNDTITLNADKVKVENAADNTYELSETRLYLPTGIAPDAYYTQCLGGSDFAIGSDYYVTAGMPEIQISSTDPKPGDEITVKVSNFATGYRMAWDGIPGNKILKTNPYEDVEIRYGANDTPLGTIPIVRNADGTTTGEATFTIPSDFEESEYVTALQGHRSAEYNRGKYTVTFDPTGGQLPQDFYEGLKGNQIQIDTSATLKEPNGVPTRSGYTFKGWLLDGQPFEFGTTLNRSITLKALWEEIPRTLNFTINGKATDSVQAGQEMTLQVTGYPAEVVVAFGLDDERLGLGIAQTDENGEATLKVKVPSSLKKNDYRLVAVYNRWEAEAKLTVP